MPSCGTKLRTAPTWLPVPPCHPAQSRQMQRRLLPAAAAAAARLSTAAHLHIVSAALGWSCLHAWYVAHNKPNLPHVWTESAEHGMTLSLLTAASCLMLPASVDAGSPVRSPSRDDRYACVMTFYSCIMSACHLLRVPPLAIVSATATMQGLKKPPPQR